MQLVESKETHCIYAFNAYSTYISTHRSVSQRIYVTYVYLIGAIYLQTAIIPSSIPGYIASGIYVRITAVRIGQVREWIGRDLTTCDNISSEDLNDADDLLA